MDSTILQPPGDYPDDWLRTDFDHFATLQRGKDLTRDHFHTRSVPVAGSSGIIGYHDAANVKGPGITVGRSGSVGKVTFYRQDFWAHNTALYVKDFHGNAPEFIACFLDFLRLGRFGSGASVPTLDRNVLRTLPVVIPPLCEQRKIAAVLGLVRRAIEQQERLITLTTELKKALLHKLFTEGLRGELQKQTEIRPVPESWEKIQIGDLGVVVTGSTPKTKIIEYYSPPEVDFIAPADLGATRLVYRSTRQISRKGLATVRPIPAEAVMCVCIGSSIGKVGIATKEASATNQQINSIICNERHDSAFVYYLLSYFSEYWRGFANFGPLPILSKGSFEAISIFVPGTIEEEVGTSRCLAAVDAKTEFHARRRDLLRALFHTTLHQLMTAQIRVDDLDLSESEIAQ